MISTQQVELLLQSFLNYERRQMRLEGSNQLQALGLYTLWASELAPRIHPKGSVVLNDENHSLLSESLILGMES